jgi:hypothetical protein
MDNTEFLRLLKIEYPNIHTFKQYQDNINRYSNNYTNNYYNDITDFEKITNYLNTELKDKSVNVKHRFISNIKKALEVLKIQVAFKEKLDTLCKELISSLKETGDNKELKELNFTFEDINKHIDTLETNSKEYLYWNILTCLPPRRLDWKNAIFIENNFYQQIEDDETNNYVVIDETDKSVHLVFHNFKTNTDHSKGPNYHRIYQRYLSHTPNFTYNSKIGYILNPLKLEKILYDLWVKYNKCNNTYVLTGTNKPMNDGQMNMFLKRKVFKPLLDKGKNVTNNNIRRLFITETLIKNFYTLTVSDKKEIAEDMGQYSIGTQQHYISCLTDDNETISQNSEISESDSDSDGEEYMDPLVEKSLMLKKQIDDLTSKYNDICELISINVKEQIIRKRLGNFLV